MKILEMGRFFHINLSRDESLSMEMIVRLFWEIICNGNMFSGKREKTRKKQLEIAYHKLRLDLSLWWDP